MAADHGPNGAYSEVFEDGIDIVQPQTIHRIRANSSIMQLKKILVANRGEIRELFYYQIQRIYIFLISSSYKSMFSLA